MAIETALILEDNPDSVQWLSQALNGVFPGLRIDSHDTVAAACAAVDKVAGGHQYDLALVDLALPDGSGIEFLGHLARTPGGEHTIAVVATIFDDDKHIFPAIQAGARGYLLKDQGMETLTESLRGIVDGRPPLSAAIARRLLGFFQGMQDDEQQVRLTPREREVLQLIGKGIRINEIADLLEISRHTAADYVKSIYRKLNINSRAEAAVEAVKRGLV